jgi:glycerol-3-phosphate acyltransferase PlsY
MTWVIIALGYLTGAIPTAYIVGRIIRNEDIRQLGDGNMGAQNAFLQLGHKIGVAVGIIDAAKGALVILIAQRAGISEIAGLFGGGATVIGHNWPVFLGFRGGRGESTTIGILLILVTKPMLIVAGPAILTLILSRNVILASAVLFAPLPFVCWWLGTPGMLVSYSIALPCLVGLTHLLRIRQTVTRPT